MVLWFFVPFVVLTVFTNPVICVFMFGELLYFEFWLERYKKPSKTECLENENRKLQRSVDNKNRAIKNLSVTVENLRYKLNILQKTNELEHPDR